MTTMGNLFNIRLYDIFRKDLRLPDDKARELVQTLDEAAKEGKEGTLEGLATKEFVKEEIYGVKEFVKDEIHRVEKNTLKAVFWSGLVQFLAVIGSTIAIIHFMVRK